MDLQSLSQAEIAAFLPTQRILRLAMDADGERYLVPLGYVWLQGAFYGATIHGRKIRMLERNPQVSFQVDDSATRDDFDWTSVTGEGTVEFVTDAAEISVVSSAWFGRFSDMPEWAAKQYEKRVQTGALIWLRIRPKRMTGREGAPNRR
jgi:nitroimidazol reductase NimA-like FMN-containing flavoprotein (pyridoxamine 5'-phosphate oxidase superfamily)